MSKRVFKWNDSRKMPVEGSVEVTLPDPAFFDPAGSGYVGSESGDQLGDGYPFALKGAGEVTTLRNSKSGVIRTQKTVGDDAGLVEWGRVDGNMMYFSGHMADTDPVLKKGALFRGYVHVPAEGAGQGEVTIEYKDQRGRVTISGWLEHELSGAEITDSNAGKVDTNPLPTPDKEDEPPAGEKKQAVSGSAVFDPADSDKSGDVSKKEQKKFDKQNPK